MLRLDAAQFITPSLGGASVGDGLVGGSGSSSGELPIGFERVEPQPEEYVFKLVPDKGKSSSRSRTFLCEILNGTLTHRAESCIVLEEGYPLRSLFRQ